MMSPRMHSIRRPRINKHEPCVNEWPIARMAAQFVEGSARRSGARLRSGAFAGRA
jgi:hypothetical protein